jgi:serine/threonine-protein kinase
LLGTPAYSAPEGIVSGSFSPSSDQFSMAATLYEALCGKRAFPGEDTVHVASRITNEPVAPIARACGLNPSVDDVLANALEKSAAARFPSAREFGNALGDALDSQPRSQLATVPDVVHRAAESSRIKRIALGSVALGALAGAGLLELTTRGPALSPEPTAASSSAPSATAIVGWLLPPARPKPRPRPAASARERAAQREAAGGRETALPDPSSAPQGASSVPR